ncbi:MAG: Sulfite exporter TauE/SafE [Methanocella sp. PtaU1.Bin125]|nr:MAG: Sulfite exporter TauE/SafE [Methanocella sp. PtaU1.Bin125]
MLAPVDIILLLMTGFVAGAFGGLLGLGGATILVPALTLGFGLPVYLVIAVSLTSNVFVSITAAIGYNRRGYVHKRTVVIMTLGSIAGVIIGTAVATMSPESLIKIAFGIFLLIIVLEGILRVPGKKPDRPIDEPEKLNVPGLSALGFIMGMLGATLGVGGGTVATPVQHSLFRLPLKNAIANSLATIIVSASLGVILYFIMGAGRLFSAEDAIITAAAVVPGSIIGAKASTMFERHLPERYIKFIFYATLLYIAYNMIKSGMGW